MIYVFQKAYECMDKAHASHILDEKKTTVTATDNFNAFGKVVINSKDKQCYLWRFQIIY